METSLFRKGGAYVRGPSIASDNALARFDLTTGRLIQNSSGILSDVGALGGLLSVSAGDLMMAGNTLSSLRSDLPVILDPDGTGGIQFTLSGGNVTISNLGVMAGLSQLNLENLRLDLNTLSSTSGALILSAAATGIQLTSATELGLNLLQFGSANEADIFFDTGLVINPKVTGTGILTIGSATGTPDGNLNLNFMGIGGSVMATNSIINAVVSSASARQVLNLLLTYTGTNNSATNVVSKITDQGSNTNMTGIGVLPGVVGDAHTHSGNTTYYGIWAQMGYTGNFTVSTGTHTGYGIFADMTIGGAGGAAITGGTFRRYGFFQQTIVAIGGTPGSDLIMGCFFNDSLNTKQDIPLYLNSTTTALGTAFIRWASGNARVEITENSVITFGFDSALNKSEVALGTLAGLVGTSTTFAKVGGVLLSSTTGVGNITTGEDDLMSYTCPASTLGADGDSYEFEFSGSFAATANNKRVRIKYGGTTMLDTTALLINSGNWFCFGRIIRTGAATQRYYVEFSTDNALLVATAKTGTAAETLSGTVTLKATGEATATDDIRNETLHVRWHPNE